MRGLILAAPGSGHGKTTLTLALLRAMRDRGLRVAPAKIGPDYIDPTWHQRAAGRPSPNLDPWAMRAASLRRVLGALAGDATFVLAEGVMGLFDGIDAVGTASTGDLAARLGWPVVLVVDAHGMAASVAPLVAGFACHRPTVAIAGVILNRVGSAPHAALLRDALAAACPGIAVLGSLPRDAAIALPERHLGLVPAREASQTETVIARAAELVAASVDLDALAGLAGGPATWSVEDDEDDGGALLAPLGQRIAIAQDHAFLFAYPAQLALWRRAGVRLDFFSPLDDEPPPVDADAVFLPGGYPELHAGRLAAASRFAAGMRAAAARGVAIYGECGGYMTLGAGLVDADGRRHAMLGLLPVETSFAERRLHLGYRDVVARSATMLGSAGARFAGHEFHYARIVSEGAGEPLFDACDARGKALGPAGRRVGSVAGSFVHLVDRRA
ncbi:MAG: cobyrinate a,c-diamide synthase [Alphaproteobacteria bacterium]|nr:cobyrinate a,c-diamide synthase [Alphaproteobacteria bacterium]